MCCILLVDLVLGWQIFSSGILLTRKASPKHRHKQMQVVKKSTTSTAECTFHNSQHLTQALPTLPSKTSYKQNIQIEFGKAWSETSLLWLEVGELQSLFYLYYILAASHPKSHPAQPESLRIRTV